MRVEELNDKWVVLVARLMGKHDQKKILMASFSVMVISYRYSS